MRKILALLLATSMALSVAACGSSTSETTSSTPAGDSTSTSTPDTTTPAKNQIVVGDITELDANILEGWGNNAANAKIRNLVFDVASTMSYTKEGQYIQNPNFVKEMTNVVNEDGSKTYTMIIADGLTYNDGSPITAKDYVFYTMFMSSPEFLRIEGGDLSNGRVYTGYTEYNKGETRTFAGIHLIDDMTFSVTVVAEELPYYYDNTYTMAFPLPMHVIAPGATLVDSEAGVTLVVPGEEEVVAGVVDMLDKDGKVVVDETTGANKQHGAYSAQDALYNIVKETVNNPQTGYRFQPKVTPGAYQLESMDTSTSQAVMTTNAKFPGTYDDVMPAIERIVMKKVTDTTMMDELKAGQVDLLTGVSGGDSIESGLDVVDDGTAQYATYLRAGYGKIAFACDFGPTQFVAVRQAIAHLLDRDEFAKQYSGGYAEVVHGYYGLSQQEAKDSEDLLENELNHYPKDLEKAEELLIADGWVLNADGSDYVKGTNTLRHKLVDGENMPLVINWANSPDNPVSDLLNTMLPGEMEKVGMKLNGTTIDFPVLLDNLYRAGDIAENPEYHMFNLGTGFEPISAVWYYFSPEKEYTDYNTNRIDDKELLDIATKMKSVEPGDYDTWLGLWQQLIVRWNFLMPDVPLYSDEYHDFFSNSLTGYEPDALWQWQHAIMYSSLTA